MTTNQKQISTTALAKKYKITSKEMFAQLLQQSFIERKDNLWCFFDGSRCANRRQICQQQAIWEVHYMAGEFTIGRCRE